MTDTDYHPNLPGDKTNLVEPVPPTKTSKNANRIVAIALIIIAAAIGLMAYWAVQPSDPLTIKNAPFPARTIRKEPTADGVIILTVNYCKNSNASGTVRTSFVSESREIFLPTAAEHIPKGCQSMEVPVIVPKDIVPDTYKIKFTITYKINPLKTAEVKTFESQPFQIAASSDPNSQIVAPQP